jgi:hypothetical protein
MIRALVFALAAVVSFTGFGCGSVPEITPQAQTAMESLLANVGDTSAQFDRAADALLEVRDAWNTDPDAAISAFSRELMALETKVNSASTPGDSGLFSQWSGTLDSILGSQTANASSSEARALESAFGAAKAQVSKLRDSFTPTYNRMMDLAGKLRESPTGATVEANLPELRDVVADSKTVSSRFDNLFRGIEAFLP